MPRGKKGLIPADIKNHIREKIKENIEVYGMSPYNAAVRAGLTKPAAERFCQQKDILDITFGDGIDDVLEQEYASIHARVRWLSKMSGLYPECEGAKKTIGNADSNVDVADEWLRLACVKELNAMGKITQSTETHDDRIQVNILVTGKDQPYALPVEKEKEEET